MRFSPFVSGSPVQIRSWLTFNMLRFICRSVRCRRFRLLGKTKSPRLTEKPYQGVEHAVPPDFTPQGGRTSSPVCTLYGTQRIPLPCNGGQPSHLTFTEKALRCSGLPLGDDFVRGDAYGLSPSAHSLKSHRSPTASRQSVMFHLSIPYFLVFVKGFSGDFRTRRQNFVLKQVVLPQIKRIIR